MHLVLGDDRGLLRILTRLGFALNGQVFGQWLPGDNHRGGMNSVLPPESLQSTSHVHYLADVSVSGVHVPEFGGHLVAVPVLLGLLHTGSQRRVAPHDQRRHSLGDPVTESVGIPKHPSGISNSGPGLDLRESDDLGHVVASILPGRIANEFVPVSGVEVHVDVRHCDSVRI